VIAMTKLVDHAGATGALPVGRGLAMDPRRFAYQPKLDGCLARVSTDRRGCIVRALSRAGLELPIGDLAGIATGVPMATLWGELECWTPASVRAVQARGYSQLHLFDATAVEGRSIATMGYEDRWGALHHYRARLELDGGSINRPWTADAEGNAHDTGGRFVRPVPRGAHDRLPIVALYRGKGAGESLWHQHVERDGGEGVVCVDLTAPAGARGAKRKIRKTHTLDAVVVSVGRGAARLVWQGRPFVVSARGRWESELQPGAVVEVAAHGFTERSDLPLHPRLVRRRDDRSIQC
jgi:hypothetical protein